VLDVHSFRVGEESYTVAYTARARYLFETLAGYPLTGLAAMRGEVSDVELPRLVCAGLEGHRVRAKARRAPWTVDEVLDVVLADATPEERLGVLGKCLEAVAAAFRSADDREAATGAEGKAPTTV